MKRTNLVLDELLLETAREVLGARTYSATVNLALQEAIRTARLRDLAELVGSGVWEGDLSQMRDDRPRRRATRGRKRPPLRHG